MIWFWTRGRNELQIETRYDNGTKEFVITIVSSDGSHSSERFQTDTAFQTRLVELERRLAREQWKHAGPTVFDPKGFPNGRLPNDD